MLTSSLRPLPRSSVCTGLCVVHVRYEILHNSENHVRLKYKKQKQNKLPNQVTGRPSFDQLSAYEIKRFVFETNFRV